MKTPEERVILRLPQLFKVIKKTLPTIRNKYIAKELEYNTLKLLEDYKLIKNKDIRNEH